MMTDTASVDWLDDIHELNRLFLGYLRQLAREHSHCLELPRPVVIRLREAGSNVIDRLAELPTALFRVNVSPASETRERVLPRDTLEQMRLCLTLTILSTAWHMARGRPFEARMFLHLSIDDLRRLRTLPLSRLAGLATSPDVLSCAFDHADLTWPALVRIDDTEERMLTLIALQPEAPAHDAASRRQQQLVRALA